MYLGLRMFRDFLLENKIKIPMKKVFFFFFYFDWILKLLITKYLNYWLLKHKLNKKCIYLESSLTCWALACSRLPRCSTNWVNVGLSVGRSSQQSSMVWYLEEFHINMEELITFFSFQLVATSLISLLRIGPNRTKK